MDFGYSEEQQLTRQMAREFAEREIAPYVAQWDAEERFPLETAKRMGQLGMLGGVIPETYGGAGMSYQTYTVLIEELARYDQALAGVASFPSGLMGSGLLLYGSEEQKRRYLTPLARGEIFAGTGSTEPRSGTDVAGMTTTCARDGDGYVIHGAKMWISMLDVASFFLTFAMLDRSKGRKGICAFIVEKGTPGLRVAPVKNKVGYRTIATGELALDGVRVPAENRVGAEGQGFEVVMCAVENGRLSVAARAVGVTQACLDASVKYAQERVVFGQPIGHYQLIQSKITDMLVGLEAARLLVYKLAWLKDQGAVRARRESSIAKMFATDVLMKAATDACQIHGAYSCSPEYPVGRYFRDAKFFQIVEGTNEIHRVLIAEMTLGYRTG
jgi:alkylation response protein AidB-like acyl-CoA dehydrogenase